MDWKKIVDNGDYEGIKEFIQSNPGEGKNIMIYAAQKGNLDMVKYLVEECGCDPHVKDEAALKEAAKYGYLDMVKYLVEECGCDPHVNNEEPLRRAAWKGYLDVVKYLIEGCNCDPHSLNEEVLRRAAWGGYLDVVKYLIEEYECDPHVKDEGALKLAVWYGRREIVKYLVENCKCDVEKVKNIEVYDTDIYLYLISKGVWGKEYDKNLTLKIIMNAEKYFNNETFLTTIYNNTQKEDIKEFISKLIKKYAEDIAKTAFIGV